MSIKPEFSLRQVTQVYKTLKYEIPEGAFIGRLYWSDFALYNVTGRKLDKCQTIKDNNKRWHRVVEFVVSSYETARFLVENCNASNKFYIVSQTKSTLRKMQDWSERNIPMIQAVKRPALPVVEKAALPVEETTAIVSSIDDIAPSPIYIPGEVQLASIKSDPASEEQVRDLFSQFFHKNYRRRLQWIKAINYALPIQYLVSFSKGTKAEKAMELVIQNVLKLELTVEELTAILAGS